MTVTLRGGADLWVEVQDFRGRFWIRHDASIVDLVLKMQAGGYAVEEPRASTRAGRRRGTEAR